jgi:flagellar biosynthesis chaperone FliJ
MKGLLDEMIKKNKLVLEFLEEIKSLDTEKNTDKIINLKEVKEEHVKKLKEYYDLQDKYEKGLMEIIFADSEIVFK